MKTLFKLMGIAVLSACVCSCSALFRPNEDAETGSVALVLDTHATGTDTRAAVFSGANLQISLTGDYRAEQTVTVSGSQAAVRFEGIPVGSSVRVRVSGQTSDERSFFYGNSSTVTIRKGQNTVVVPIEAKRSTPYVLWNKAPSTQIYGLYATQTPDKISTATEPTVKFENESEFMGFCFDNDANLYIIHRISSDTSSEVTITLKKYEYSEKDASYNPEPASRPLTDLTANTHSLFVTCDNDNLYIATGRETSDPSPVALYYAPRKTALETSEYEPIPTVIANSAAVELTAIAAADGIVYVAYNSSTESAGTDGSTDSDTIGSTGSDTFQSNTISIAAYGTDGKKAEASDVANMLGLETRADVDTQISDLLVQDGVLYVLISQTGELSDPYCYYSRGGVAKFSPSDLKPNTSFGSNGILGWTANAQKIESSSSSNPIDCYWPATAANAFYGPMRFAAIRPKKLVIADDGVTIEEENNQASIKQKNAIVEINLDSFATLERIPVNVEFDRYIDSFNFSI
ncbi:hypothetical protein [Treponema brennaborense]|uniref:Lipoprotein n=1 Tax=Treponema brennaborense (strain DSM 12168 / CIP 105900 / DD5/3) TaxID=906968 RepID=F4LM77_TREBD|nr:hypothetical protein [Treponema brennaborense]AEE17743.1 hypothetical protein Trebr_2334 [Treponema brennaborense DSM 12168]